MTCLYTLYLLFNEGQYYVARIVCNIFKHSRWTCNSTPSSTPKIGWSKYLFFYLRPLTREAVMLPAHSVCEWRGQWQRGYAYVANITQISKNRNKLSRITVVTRGTRNEFSTSIWSATSSAPTIIILVPSTLTLNFLCSYSGTNSLTKQRSCSAESATSVVHLQASSPRVNTWRFLWIIEPSMKTQWWVIGTCILSRLCSILKSNYL